MTETPNNFPDECDAGIHFKAGQISAQEMIDFLQRIPDKTRKISVKDSNDEDFKGYIIIKADSGDEA